MRTSINKKARKKIAEIAEKNDWTRCMIRLPKCMGEAHAPAHRHKRRWYYGKDDELLWDIKEWIPACTGCHMKIEYDKELTERVFKDWLNFIKKAGFEY